MAASGSRRGTLLLAAVALAAVAVGFAGTVRGYFLTDDWFILGKSAQFRSGNLLHVFALGPGQLHWRPLADFVWAVEFDLFGVHPEGWHLLKLALLALSAFLLGLLARRITGAAATGVLATALFALHPLGCAPGVWIAATHENLLVVFVLATLLALDRHARDGASLLPVAAGFVGAVLSKETGATLPALALAHAFLVARPGEERRRSIRATALLALLVLAYAGVRFAAGAVPGADSPFRPPLADLLWSLSLGPLRWIALPVSETAHANPSNALLAFALVTAVVLARWLAARAPGGRGALFGLLFVPVAMTTIAPFFTSEAMGPEMWRGLFVAHYLHLPTAGACLALAVAAGASGRGRGFPWLGGIFLVALFALTLRRNLEPWVEAGEISSRFGAGVRELVPTRDASRPVAVAFVDRPVWYAGEHAGRPPNSGIRIDPGQLVQVALEKKWTLPPYPTGRGIPLEEVSRYLDELGREMPYKVVPYATRAEALAAARRGLAEGVSREDIRILEWDRAARALVAIDAPRPGGG